MEKCKTLTGSVVRGLKPPDATEWDELRRWTTGDEWAESQPVSFSAPVELAVNVHTDGLDFDCSVAPTVPRRFGLID